MVEIAVEIHEADGPAIDAAVGRFQAVNYRHGVVLRCAGKRPRRESIGHQLQWIGAFFHCSHDFGNQVNDVGIELHLLVGFHFHCVATAAEVVAGQIHEHHVFGGFLGIVEELLGRFSVGGIVARSLERPGYRVDFSLTIFDENLLLG